MTKDYIVKMADQYFIQQNIVIGHLNHVPVTHVYPALVDIIRTQAAHGHTQRCVPPAGDPHVTSA